MSTTEPRKLTRRLPRELPALIGLAALVLIGASIAPGFLHIEVRDGRFFGVPIDILKTGTPVFLISCGMTLVIAAGCIDLSVGATMALSGACAAIVLNKGGGVPAAVATGLGAGLGVGLLNSALVSVLRLQPIIATLATMVGVRGIAQWLSDDQKVRFASEAFERLGRGSFLGVPTPIVIEAVAAVLVIAICRTTRLGMTTESVGDNVEGARRCGVSLGRVRAIAFAITGLLTGLAGMIAAADIGEADVANSGLSIELDAILGVVLGGTALTGGRARLVGSLIGAAIMQTLTTLLQMKGVLTDQTLMIKAVVAFSAAYAQSPEFVRQIAAMRGRHRRAVP